MGVSFFPRMTEELVKEIDVASSDYQFFYESEGETVALMGIQKGRFLTLEDVQEVWNLSEDGVEFEKVVDIEHPEKLFGEDGVVPSTAYAALCVVWTCKTLSQTGVIYPCFGEYGEDGVHVRFRHKFEPGTLKDDLTLDLALYLKTATESVLENELHLMNEAGVLLGSLEEACQVNFKGNIMFFPMGEMHAPGDPLWWIEFSDWDDPREDQFTDDNVLLILNTAHKDCPSSKGNKAAKQEILNEIFASAFYLMFEKVREFNDSEPWVEMMNSGAGSSDKFAPGSICGVLHQVSLMAGEDDFIWTSPEGRMMSLKKIVDQRMGGDL